MSKNPASCPGISQFMRPTPSYLRCPRCSGNLEIWSDENEAQCPSCGFVVAKDTVQSCLDWCEYPNKCRELIEAKRKDREE